MVWYLIEKGLSSSASETLGRFCCCCDIIVYQKDYNFATQTKQQINLDTYDPSFWL